MPTSDTKKAPFLLRLLKGLGLFVGGILLLVVLIIGGAALFLSTAGGTQWAVNTALEQVNKVIPGRLTLGRAEVEWLDHIELFDVALLTPEGGQVLRADRLLLAYELPPLFSKTLSLNAVEIDAPEIALITYPGGETNLDRAIDNGDTTPTPTPTPANDESALAIEVQAPKLQIRDGLFVQIDTTAEAPRQVALTSLNLDAAYALLDGLHSVQIRPLTLSLQEPPLGPASLQSDLELNLNDEGTIQLNTLALGAEGLALTGSGGISNFNKPTGTISLQADPIDTALAQALAPDVPLKGIMALSLDLKGEGGVVALDGALTLPEGLLKIMGALDLSRLSEDRDSLGYDLKLLGEDIAPSAFYSDDLPTMEPLNFTLTAKGAGIDPDTLTAEVTLSAQKGAVEGYVYKEANIDATLEGGTVDLHSLSLLTPYGDLEAKGQVDLDGPLALNANLEVPDLGPIGATAGQSLKGRASIKAKASGTLEDPKATFSGLIKDVAIVQGGETSLSLKSLTLDGDFVMVNEGPKVDVTGTGEALSSAAFSLARFSLDGGYQGDTASLTLEGVDPDGSPLMVQADATLGDTTLINTKALEIPVGDNSWTLQAPFQVTLINDDITIEPFKIKATREGGLISAGGVFSQSGYNDLVVEAKGVSLGPLAPLMGESMAGLRGEVGLDARIKGPSAAPNIRATATLEGIAAETIPAFGGDISLKTRGPGSGTGLTIDLSFADGGSLKGTLTAPIEASLESAPTFDADGSLGGSLTLDRYDLSALNALMTDPEAKVKPSDPRLAGTLNATLELGGHPSKPDLTLTSKITSLSYAGDKMNAALNISLAEEILEMNGQLTNPAMEDATFLTLTLTAPMRIGEDLTPQAKWEDAIDAQVLLKAPDARVLSPLDPELAKLKGIIDMDLRAKGKLGDPALQLSARGRRLRYGDVPETQLDLEIAFAKGQAATIGRMKVGNQPISAIDGRLKMNLGEALQGGDLALRDLRFSLDVPSFDLTSLPRQWRGNRLEGGVLRASALVVSPGSKPEFELEVAASDITVSGIKNQDIALQGGYQGERLILKARALDDERPSLVLDGDLPMAITLPLGGAEAFDYVLGDNLDVTATLDGLNLVLLNAFLPQDGWIEGELFGDLKAKGSPSEPDLLGKIALEGGRVFFPTYGVYFDPVSLEATLDPEGVELTSLSIGAKEGSLKAKGSVAIFDEDSQALGLKADFDNFQVINGPLGRLTLDGGLTFKGSMESPELEGDIVIPEGIIKLPDIRRSVIERAVGIESSKSLADTELPEGIWVLTEDDFLTWEAWLEGTQAEESTPTNLSADVRVSIPRNLWLRNDSGEIVTEVKGDIRARMVQGTPILTGTIETIRGEIRLFAEPLVIKEGEVTFTGGREIDPRIDLLASAETEDYGVVSLKVNGPISDPDLEFLSEQGYEPGDVVSILIVGRPLSQGAQGGDEAEVTSQMESIAAGLLSSWAQRTLADKTPLDYIEISADGFSSADLRVGKYLTEDLFLSYQRKLDSSGSEEENVNEVRAEYQITRDLYLESFYGDANIWGAELFWRRQY